jgi:hypothetical protein
MIFTIKPDTDAAGVERLRGILEASDYAHNVRVSGRQITFDARDADVLSAVRREMRIPVPSE